MQEGRWHSIKAKEVAAPVLLLAAAVLVSAVSVARRPDRFDTGDIFVLGEAGINLAAVQTLLDGGRLYEDFMLPYGPVPWFLLTALARWLGNTIGTYTLYLQITSLAHLTLLYALLRQATRVGTSLLVAALGLIPIVVVPGLDATMNSAYTTIERCLFTAVFLAWAPLPRRGPGRSVVLGLLLGLCQWVKFGGAAFLYAPIAVLDLIGLVTAWRDRAGRWRAVRAGLAVPIAAALVEAARVGYMLGTLPSPIAWDVIWPAYTASHYAAETARGNPAYPLWWAGWGYFFGQQLNRLVALAVGLGTLAWLTWRLGRQLAAGASREGTNTLEEFRLMLPVLFFIGGSIVYFGHGYNFLNYSWCLFAATGAALERLPNLARGLVLLAWLPTWLLLAKVGFVDHPPIPVVPYGLPNGETVFVTRDERDSLAELIGLLKRSSADPTRTKVLCIPYTSGAFVFCGLQPATRYAFLIPRYVRGYDRDHLARQLRETRAIVVVLDATHDEDVDSALAAVFETSLCAQIRSQTRDRVWISDRRAVVLLGPTDRREPPASATSQAAPRGRPSPAAR